MVINLFGGPGSGKSTTAAHLFTRLKTSHFNAELITEYAKDLTWEKRLNILEEDQLYILAKQHRRLLRIKDHVEYAISDSPLVLSPVYFGMNKYTNFSYKTFNELTLELFKNYPNVNILLNRREDNIYQAEGRNQDLKTAEKIDKEIEKYLYKNNIRFTALPINLDIVDNIIGVLRKKSEECWDGV